MYTTFQQVFTPTLTLLHDKVNLSVRHIGQTLGQDSRNLETVVHLQSPALVKDVLYYTEKESIIPYNKV